MSRAHVEVGLYFDDRDDMTLKQVAEYLQRNYPIHHFGSQHDYKLDHNPRSPRGLFVLYPSIVADPHFAWLNEAKAQGYIRSFAVFPARTWSGYLKDKQVPARRQSDPSTEVPVNRESKGSESEAVETMTM